MKVRPQGAPRTREGFSLIELLVVVGLVAVLTGLLVAGLGGQQGRALEAGRVVLEQMVRAARERALATGRPARLLFQHDAGHARAAERYLRVITLQELRGELWHTIAITALPEQVRIVPHQIHAPDGLATDEASWRRRDGSRLHSSALFQPRVSVQVDSLATESWVPLQFSAHGTTATAGQIVLATIRPRARGDGGGVAFEFSAPEQVRGLQLSVYGLTLPINRREEF